MRVLRLYFQPLYNIAITQKFRKCKKFLLNLPDNIYMKTRNGVQTNNTLFIDHYITETEIRLKTFKK